ncbi:hypothetical protein I41_51670 [Lacipirellula limnantheis]|uniref:Uncharacterized protein n=1 Tax=Lacipirellula limnantheis TaxID=2528024 RepID=A0A517U5L4_9BACT|nr:hypothetical protein I41_51670 [Lacipirellula limnantheis]
MYCSECGTKGTGKFCTGCGNRLAAADASGTAVADRGAANGGELNYDPSVVLAIDWSDLVDYEQLMSIPAVRDRIARAAAQSKKRMTGEEILDLYGKALGKLAGVPLPMSAIAGFAQSAYAKLGVKTGKSQATILAIPPGETLVRLLCSLAKEGRSLRDVQQLADGCIVKAALPSDLFALEGDLVVAVVRQGRATRVEAHTDIPGQMFDWGKSTRCLEGLLGELGAAAAA